MKKIAILLCTLLILSALGCSNTQETTTTTAETGTTTAAETTTVTETTTTSAETTTPAQTTTAAAEADKWADVVREIYNTYGVDVNLPNLAENVQLTCQTGYAQVDFIYQKAACTLLAAPHDDDVFPKEGKYSREKEYNWLGFEYEVEWNDDGSSMAEWDDDATDAEYRLIVKSGLTQEEISELVVILLPTSK